MGKKPRFRSPQRPTTTWRETSPRKGIAPVGSRVIPPRRRSLLAPPDKTPHRTAKQVDGSPATHGEPIAPGRDGSGAESVDSVPVRAQLKRACAVRDPRGRQFRPHPPRARPPRPRPPRPRTATARSRRPGADRHGSGGRRRSQPQKPLRAERLRDRAKPVVAGEPSSPAGLETTRIEVDVVVDDKQLLRRKLEEPQRRRDGAPRIVHVRLRLDQREPGTVQPRLRQLAGELSAPPGLGPPCQLFHHHPAHVVARALVLASGIPEPRDQQVDRRGMSLPRRNRRISGPPGGRWWSSGARAASRGEDAGSVRTGQYGRD